MESVYLSFYRSLMGLKRDKKCESFPRKTFLIIFVVVFAFICKFIKTHNPTSTGKKEKKVSHLLMYLSRTKDINLFDLFFENTNTAIRRCKYTAKTVVPE